MRLTLRTLLAYLDGNLEPDDSQDIGKKIEESEFATKLVHLIRDCTRRLRLGAPTVLGKGLGTDPNSVAEYLEYRLADDRVPEFERICLESEIHLAEVASCHQILTLVLGEPAEIDGAMRERLYRVTAHPDEPVAAVGVPVINTAMNPAAALPLAPSATPPPVARRAKPEVPEYLRENRWRWWPVAAMVVIAAAVTLAGLLVFGPTALRDQMTALVSEPGDEGEAEPIDEPAATDTDKPADPAPSAEPVAKQADEPPADGGPAEAPLPPLPADSSTATPSPVVAPEKMPGEDPDAPPAPEPAPLPDEKSATPLPPEPKPDPPEPLKPADGAKPEEMPPKPLPGVPGTAPDAAPGAAQAPREPAEGFGRMSKTSMLLKLDPASGNWARLKPLAPLEKGDRLLSLPLFRPSINLSSNITVQPEGAALFELEGWDAEGVPIISLQYGCFLLNTIGKTGNPLKLKVDGHETLVTFVDAESSLALEVRHDLAAGQDPEAGPATLVANVFATDGLIRLSRDGEPPIEFQAPSARALVSAAAEPPAGGAFPAWVSDEAPSQADERAVRDLGGYVTSDKQVGLQLRELTDAQHKLGKRREVRSLATRCLAHMGDFEPSLTVLNDPDLHNFWPVVVEELQAALAQGPSSAAAVRATLEKQRGAQDGAALYRMLWGYSAADLAGGADRNLVAALDRNDALDFRVLGILNLAKLNGGATHGYHPEDSDINRRQSYNTWKQRIGKMTPRAPAAKPRTPAAKKAKEA